jgi:hypothetical protein
MYYLIPIKKLKKVIPFILVLNKNSKVKLRLFEINIKTYSSTVSASE